jgi:hypothetical protein
MTNAMLSKSFQCSAVINRRYGRKKNGGDHFDRRRELSNQLSFCGAT